MRNGARIFTAAALAALSTLATAANATAAPVACGDIVTTSVTLTADLTCSGAGLVVGADNVTIDLAGHVIRGNGSGIGIAAVDFTNTRIRNGTIRQFQTGIDYGSTSLGATNGPFITNVRLINNGTGVNLFNAIAQIERVRLAENSVRGILIQSSSANILNSVITRNGVGFETANTWYGTFSGNEVTFNLGDGMIVGDPGGATIKGNKVNWNGHSGIVVYSNYPLTGTTLANNVAEANGNWGIDVEPAFPDNSLPDNGGGNVARHNGQPLQCRNFQCIT